MSLYDGVGLNLESKPDTVGWQGSSSIKLLQSQLVAKKASLQQRAKRSSLPIAPSNVSSGAQRDGATEISVDATDESATSSVPQLGGPGAGFSFASGVPAMDEYDPMRPNEYEEVKRKRSQQMKHKSNSSVQRRRDDDEDSKNRSRSPRDYEGQSASKVARTSSPDLSPPPMGSQPLPSEAGPSSSTVPSIASIMGNKPTPGFAGRYSDSEDEELESEKNAPDPSKKGAAIAPPSVQLQAQEKLIAANPIVAAPVPDRPYAKIFHKTDSSMQMGTSVAAKIMKQYGYKEGTGLGKSGQGIATALSVEKTSKRGGKIINADHEVREAAKREQEEQESITEMMKRPSKVILLKNMVGPGEVDEDLEPETAEECSKYGDVVKVVIFEMPNIAPDYLEGSDDAVRIFVEFKRMESAIKGLVDLNGRWFGGRQVRASFYDMDRFELMELAD